MKTIKLCAVLLTSSLLFCSLPLSAQNEAESQTSSTEQTGGMSKKEARRAQRANWKPEDYLPKAGSWALSINANPFLNPSYIFDFDDYYYDDPELGAVGGSAYLSPVLSIAGKYMVTDNLGVRLNVGWLYNLESNGAYSRNDMNPEARVVDRQNYHNAGASFNIAAEYRIGKRRVQGVVGGGLLYAFNYSGINYSYGNAITPENPSPTFNSFYYDSPYKSGYSSARYLRRFYGNPTHYLGLMGFVGVEWFISPWFSLGAEVNVAAVYNWTQKLYYEAEGFNEKTKQQETWREQLAPSSRGFTFGTGNFGANFNLTFYFNRDK